MHSNRRMRKITDDHYRRIRKFIGEVQDGFDPEAIHRFRVEYKKIRSFLRLICFSRPHSQRINVGPTLKKGYHIAGEIRDRQLLLLKIRELYPVSGRGMHVFQAVMENEIGLLKQRWKKKMRHPALDKVGKNLSRKIPGTFSMHDFHAYTKYKQKQLMELGAVRYYSDRRLHTIRKILKDFTYNLVNIPQNFRKRKQLPAKELDARTEMIINDLGEHQDLCAILQLINEARKLTLSGIEKRVMDTFKSRLIGRKKLLKSRLAGEMRGIIFSADYLPSLIMR